MQTSIFVVFLTSCLFASGVAAGPLHQTECSRNCGGFDRGYAWVLSNAISSEFECDGYGSAAFIAGCAAYIDDNLPDQSFSINPDDGDDEDDEEDHVLQHD